MPLWSFFSVHRMRAHMATEAECLILSFIRTHDLISVLSFMWSLSSPSSGAHLYSFEPHFRLGGTSPFSLDLLCPSTGLCIRLWLGHADPKQEVTHDILCCPLNNLWIPLSGSVPNLSRLIISYPPPIIFFFSDILSLPLTSHFSLTRDVSASLFLLFPLLGIHFPPHLYLAKFLIFEGLTQRSLRLWHLSIFLSASS